MRGTPEKTWRGYLNSNVTVAVRDNAPLVPVMVSAWIPFGVVRLACTVIAELVPAAAGFGAKLADALFGSPVTVNATSLGLVSFTAVVTVNRAGRQRLTDRDSGLAAMPKSAGGCCRTESKER